MSLLASGKRCRGSPSTRITASRPTRGRRRWHTSSTGARSCSSTTSCSGRRPTADGWPDAGCPGCSYTADSLDGAVVHLPPRGVTFVAVSRAPLENLQAYRSRMGWGFPWVSAAGSDFNLDFAVFTDKGRKTGAGFNFGTPKHAAEIDLRRDELHGLSAFALEDGVVYHTYSCYDRGTDALNATWQLLDRSPKGRGGDPHGWPRRHDEYPR